MKYPNNLDFHFESLDTELFYTDNAADWHDVVEELNALATEEEEKYIWTESFVGAPAPKVSMRSRGGSSRNQDLVPQTLMTVKSIQGKESRKILRVVFDSGGSHTMIHRSSLPLGTQAVKTEAQRCQTIAGIHTSSETVRLRDCHLPEFSKTKTLHGKIAQVFDSPCNYDVIMGRDWLHDIGMLIDFNDKKCVWMETELDMQPRNHFDSRLNVCHALEFSNLHFCDQLLDADEVDDDDFDSYADSFIAEAKYGEVTPREVADKQKHLSEFQRKQLETTLAKYDTIFDGGLGHYTKRQIHLDVNPHVVPVHSKPYSVPKVHEQIFKKELKHLVDIGVLSPIGATEWACPTFIIPKKVDSDGQQRVRWISDMRELNKALKRKVYPLPNIQDVLMRRSGYSFFTKLDLSMMYYALELDDESKEICTIVTPYGKFAYQRMAMGLKTAPDEAQAIIEETLRDLDVETYIDDIGIFTNGTYEDHLRVIETVLTRLQDAGFRINPLKCEWAVQETDFLGYWLTPHGIRPWKRKIDAILKMSKPQNVSQLRSFLGAVTFYRNMWPRRSHLLAPLTALTGSSMFQWTPECDRAFDEMKAVLAADALNAFPNHELPFDVYTDASDYQMGAVIMQNGKPVAYWSRKLNDAQKNYSTMEKEMLSIVSCLREYRSMLLGTNLTIHTDHKNLTFRTLNTQRVLRWRMYLEEYHPRFLYCPGKDNVLADCFSRLPRMEKPTEGKTLNKGKLIAFDKLKVPKLDDEIYAFDDIRLPPNEHDLHKAMNCRFSCCRDLQLLPLDDEVVECFLNHPAMNVMPNPITMQTIQEHQFNDVRLQLRAHDPRFTHQFPVKYVQGRPVLCFRPYADSPQEDWRIAIPVTLITRIVEWYHIVLGHVGSTQLYETIRRNFHFPSLKAHCERFKCNDCQKNKQWGPGYGELPPRNAPLMPWDEVAIDLIGPWSIELHNGQKVEFNALTCIDPVTNLVEIIRINRKTAEHVAQKFEDCWLARYPRPNRCVHDNGGEFIGEAFQLKLQEHGVTDVHTTSRNPQGNAVCERMHQTVANVLRTKLNVNNPLHLTIENAIKVKLATNQPLTVEEAESLVDQCLATAMYATRVQTNRSLGISPGALVFQRDMFLDIPLIADIVQIRDGRQVKIDQNLERENRRRTWNYAVGQEVLIKTVAPAKLQAKAHGPYTVVQVFQNGTVLVRRNAEVVERMNIRRLIPYRRT